MNNLEPIPNESILPDDYPVQWCYLYVCDGKVASSPIQGTVRDLKRELKVSEVRRCNIKERANRLKAHESNNGS